VTTTNFINYISDVVDDDNDDDDNNNNNNKEAKNS
jgi:hypothetical protein